MLGTPLGPPNALGGGVSLPREESERGIDVMVKETLSLEAALRGHAADQVLLAEVEDDQHRNDHQH